MIDQDLISNITLGLHDALRSIKTTPSSSLGLLSDVIPDDAMVKLKDYLGTVDPSMWISMDDQYGSRKKITWDQDTVIEELHEGFNAATEEINRIYPGDRKNFWGISIWQDSPGYFMELHTDNPDIDAAIQIYLFGDSDCPGTDFYLGDDKISVEFSPNSGYIACHSGKDKIPHKLSKPVPDNTLRYSLYAVWSRFPKYSADAQG